MEHYLGVARKEGITDEEIGVVQSVVMALAGCRVRSQLQELQERMIKKNKRFLLSLKKEFYYL